MRIRPIAAARKARHVAGFLKAFVANVRRPHADSVLAMERHGTALATPEDTARYIAGLLADAPTQELLRDRWVPPRITREQLLAMPAGSLGRAYGDHLEAFGLDVEFFPDIDTEREDEFVRARLYQIHDILHAITGYDATDAGEVGIVGFYLAQYLTHHDEGGLMAGGFMGLLAATVILHAAVVDNDQLRPFFDHLVEGYERGRASKCLIGPRWETMLDRQLAAVRAEYRVPPRAVARSTVAHA
ncbi:MAG: hypothetical protein EP330_06050 [Deltaproteobacteria bacterium]|nr:MAG: hypothetical protein EP330_06050 [Deltaproteobacteria bacterium]